MKSNIYALLAFSLIAAPLTAHAAEQLIPAGSLIQCTVSEPRLSSKTADVGDPVLCQVSHVELYGRSVLPYGSYMVGRFEEYKDPGHFVGRGWMELKFERMVIPPDQVVPVSAKLVYVPNYPVDKRGRIRGKGHPVRDIVEWSIPILWPIDIFNLPRRGPRPILKDETRLTLKIMDDLGVPAPQQAAYGPYYPQSAAPAPPYYPRSDAPRYPYGFRHREPMSYAPPAAVPLPDAQPIQHAYPQPSPSEPVWREPDTRPLTLLVLRDGNERLATDYWFEGGVQLRYVAVNGSSIIIPIGLFDLPTTIEKNRRRGVTFTIRSKEQ
jgi:nucleoid-associated protein YgaU